MEVVVVTIEYEDGQCVWKYVTGENVPVNTEKLKEMLSVRVNKTPEGWEAQRRPIKNLKVVARLNV